MQQRVGLARPHPGPGPSSHLPDLREHHVDHTPVGVRKVPHVRDTHLRPYERVEDPAIAFFVERGTELEGEAPIEGRWVDRVVGLDGVRVDIAMMPTPDAHGRLELTKFHTPTAVSAEPQNAPANTLGLRSIMFAVDDIEDVVARLRTHGAELVGELVQYQDSYRLCYVRGPEGIIVALAEQLS